MSLMPYSDIRRMLDEFNLVKRALAGQELEAVTKENLERMVTLIKARSDGKLQLKAYLLALKNDSNEDAGPLYQDILEAI